MPSFFNLAKIKRLLLETAQGDALAEQMLRASGNLPALDHFAEQAAGARKDRTAADALRLVLDAMADYLAAIPAPPIFRQKYWTCCRDWAARLAAALALPVPEDFSETVPQPIAADTGISLIHALHAEEAKTKAALAQELGVSEKTVQTTLRAIDPSLQAGGRPVPPMRIGGYTVRANIEQEVSMRPDSEGRARHAYRMKNRLHPFVLQLNTMQVGALLRALQTLCTLEDNTSAREIALDLWAQLSEPGRARIDAVYGARYEAFEDFLSELQEELSACRVSTFRTEDEMQENLTMRENLEYAFKGGAVCSFPIRQNGELRMLHRVRLDWSMEDSACWLAIPAEEYPDRTHAVPFRRDELCGFLDYQKPDQP